MVPAGRDLCPLAMAVSALCLSLPRGIREWLLVKGRVKIVISRQCRGGGAKASHLHS